MNTSAFTLIELLIVVAIIAILAAIAIPNFANARTRTLVVRTVADLKALVNAFEMYSLDNGGRYVPDYDGGVAGGCMVRSEVCTFLKLTTPVAYISSIPLDIWITKDKFVNSIGKMEKYYEYWGKFSRGKERIDVMTRYGMFYVMRSLGPDLDRDYGADGPPLVNLGMRTGQYSYRRSNGLRSSGDFLATNRGIE